MQKEQGCDFCDFLIKSQKGVTKFSGLVRGLAKTDSSSH